MPDTAPASTDSWQAFDERLRRASELLRFYAEHLGKEMDGEETLFAAGDSDFKARVQAVRSFAEGTVGSAPLAEETLEAIYDAVLGLADSLQEQRVIVESTVDTWLHDVAVSHSTESAAQIAAAIPGHTETATRTSVVIGYAELLFSVLAWLLDPIHQPEPGMGSLPSTWLDAKALMERLGGIQQTLYDLRAQRYLEECQEGGDPDLEPDSAPAQLD